MDSSCHEPTIQKQEHAEATSEYSKKKLIENLIWRKSTNITNKIAHHINSDGSGFSKLTNSIGSLYWYGVDCEGSPNLWYRTDKTCFDSAIVQKEMECCAMVMQAGLDVMPPKTHRINFIACCDVFNPLKMMKKPTLAPAFMKTFITIFPDRLKNAYTVTGTIGHIFYKLADTLAPANIMDKFVEIRSREDTARVMITEGIISIKELPDFMGGEYVHDEQIITNFPTMIRSIALAMERDQNANPLEITTTSRNGMYADEIQGGNDSLANDDGDIRNSSMTNILGFRIRHG